MANTLYAALGLQPSATAEEIEQAFARSQHAGQDDVDASSLRRIAYDTLRNPEQRAAYDRKLARQQESASGVQAVAVEYVPSQASGKGKWFVLILLLAAVAYFGLQGRGHAPAAGGIPSSVAPETAQLAPESSQLAVAEGAVDGEEVVVYDPAAVRPAVSPPAGRQAAQVVLPTRGARKDGFDPEYLAWSSFTIRQRGKVGSGVLIGPDRILTNCHVLAGGATGIVVIHSLTRQTTKVEKYARLDGEDACLLYAPGAGGEVIEMGNSAALQANDTLYSFGHPGGSENVIWSEGKLLDRTRLGGEEFLMSSNYCRPGSSGGPLLDGHGRLVGIITAGQLYQLRGGEIRHGACLSVTEATARGLLRKSLFPIGFAPAQYHQNY